jgi:cysteine desulfurase/selenocysteine lyase
MIEKQDILYFDWSSTIPMPKEVSAKLYEQLSSLENYRRQGSNIEQKVRQVRKKVANYINGNENNIAFTGTSTYISNLIAHSLCESKIMKVITTPFDHHSTSAPWYELETRSKAQVIEFSYETVTNEEQFISQIIKTQPDVLILTTINNVTGESINVEKIVKAVKNALKDLIIVCDSAQACFMPELNGQANQIDFLYFSAHKMYGPKSLGILHLNDTQMENFKPLFIGGGGIHKISKNKVIRKDVISQIESGTIDTASIIAFGEAIDYTIENYETEYIQSLSNYFMTQASQINDIMMYSQKSKNQIAFNIKGIHNHDLASYLRDKKIIIRAGNLCNSKLMAELEINGCIRISFGMKNTKNQIDIVITQIKEFIRMWNNV